jgi:hypothetical protein
VLRDFVAANRGEILARARLRVCARNAPVAADSVVLQGLSVFLEQLGTSLSRASAREAVDHVELTESASVHGQELFEQGLTAAQVVHDYGDLCQVITGLAVEQGASIEADEFQTLNLCLDDAIAGAVTAFGDRREDAASADELARLRDLTHDMRNLLGTVMLAFASIKKGAIAPSGSTSLIMERNLIGLQALTDRLLGDARDARDARDTPDDT